MFKHNEINYCDAEHNETRSSDKMGKTSPVATPGTKWH